MCIPRRRTRLNQAQRRAAPPILPKRDLTQAMLLYADWLWRVGGKHSEDIMPPRSTAAKARIIGRSKTMPEIASEIAEALSRLADEVSCVGGSLAYIAAEQHTSTAGEQRQLAAVIYHTAKKQFGGVKYDGQDIDKATIEQLDKMWLKMLGKPSR